jgi:hypothetical protein
MSSGLNRIDPTPLFLNLHRCIEREWKTVLFRFALKQEKKQDSDSSELSSETPLEKVRSPVSRRKYVEIWGKKKNNSNEPYLFFRKI